MTQSIGSQAKYQPGLIGRIAVRQIAQRAGLQRGLHRARVLDRAADHQRRSLELACHAAYQGHWLFRREIEQNQRRPWAEEGGLRGRLGNAHVPCLTEPSDAGRQGLRPGTRAREHQHRLRHSHCSQMDSPAPRVQLSRRRLPEA